MSARSGFGDHEIEGESRAGAGRLGSSPNFYASSQDWRSVGERHPEAIDNYPED
jgi:hypothetical protein